jgi:hypothetical protein
MLFKKKRTLEMVEKDFLDTYRKFEEAKKELRLATGWSFKMSQTIMSNEEDASLRDDLVNKINLISKEFNTK